MKLPRKIFLLFLFTIPSLVGSFEIWKNPLLTLPEGIAEKKILSSFQNRCDYYGQFSKGFSYQHGAVSLYLNFLDELPSGLTEEERELFTKTTQEKEGQLRTVYTYTFGSAPSQVNFFPSQHSPLPLEFDPTTVTPKGISISDCAKVIQNKKTIFFTGAGVSAAAGIHTISSLWKDVWLDFNVPIDRFVLTSLHQPEQLVYKILEFYGKARDCNPTAAHFSLAQLAKNKSCQILTGNFDLLQERTGIKPLRIFYESDNKGIKEECLKEIDTVICIGMSEDIRSFLALFKQANPSGIIIAINQQQPAYLGSEDYLLKGDLQQIVPALERAILKSSHKKL